MSISQERFSEINGAVLSGDPQRIKGLNLSDSEINDPFLENDGLKLTLLQYAIKMGKKDVAPVLIDLGADLHVRDYLEYPLIHEVVSIIAITNGDPDRRNKWLHLLELLLVNNVDYNLKSKDGHTALSLANLHRAYDAVGLLESHGATGRFKE